MKHPTGMNETDVVNYKPLKSYMFTHRKLIHFFKKYQSYGISNVELEQFPSHITHILIIYHPENNKPAIYYLSEIEKWNKGLTWNHILSNGKPDRQKHVKVVDMETYNSLDDVPEPMGVEE